MTTKGNAEIIKAQSGLMLDDIREIEMHCKEISRLIDLSRGYWEGDAADAHIRIYKDAESDIEEGSSNIKEGLMNLRKEAGINETESGIEADSAKELPADIF